jgi:hypothetical protein
VTPNEIAKRLRALADEITMGQAARPAQVPSAESTESARPGAVVAFWDVKQSAKGTTYASLKTKADERFLCFEEALISRVDPLMRGDIVDIQLKKRKKSDGTIDFLIVGLSKAGGKAGPSRPVDEDEIPF